MDVTDKLAIIFVSLLRSGLQLSDLERSEGEGQLDTAIDEAADAFAALLAEAGVNLNGARPSGALRNAVRRSADDKANVELLVAVQDVRDTLSDGQLAAVLEGLVAVALRDDRFEAEEARFVNAVSRSLGIDAAALELSADDEARVRRLWSVLEVGEGAEGRWTPVHDLAVLYLAIAHRSDGELSTTEVDAVTRKLGEWLPSALPADVLNVVDESMRRYANGPSAQILSASVARVVESVPAHQREAVLRDLQYVAEADHLVLVEEKELIARLAEHWGINLSDLATGDNG